MPKLAAIVGSVSGFISDCILHRHIAAPQTSSYLSALDLVNAALDADQQHHPHAHLLSTPKGKAGPVSDSDDDDIASHTPQRQQCHAGADTDGSDYRGSPDQERARDGAAVARTPAAPAAGGIAAELAASSLASVQAPSQAAVQVGKIACKQHASAPSAGFTLV